MGPPAGEVPRRRRPLPTPAARLNALAAPWSREETAGRAELRGGHRIGAGRDEVWAALADVGGWRDWDSGVDRVEGQVGLGKPLTVYATMIRSRPFTVTVTELRPREAMRWRARAAGSPGRHRAHLLLDAQDDGGTVLTVREDHTGPVERGPHSR